MVHENGGYWHTASTNELETATVRPLPQNDTLEGKAGGKKCQVKYS